MNLLIRLSIFTLFLFISVSSKDHQIDFFAKLYSKPDTNAPIIKVLNDGITVEIIEEKDQWFYVVYEDTYGWLKNTSTPIQSENPSISHSFLAILSVVLIFTILIITYRKKKPLSNNSQEKEPKSSSKTIEFTPRSSTNKVLIFSKSDKNVKSQISGLYKRMSKCFEGIGFQIDFIEKINAGALTEHYNVKVIAVDYELHSNVIKKNESNIQQFGETNSKALILFYNIPKPQNIPP